METKKVSVEGGKYIGKNWFIRLSYKVIETGIDFADHDIAIYMITAVSADGTTESMGVHDVINHATQKQIDRWQLMHEEKDVAPYYDQWIKY